MSAWRLGLRLLVRDWRSGELAMLAAALVLTVGAIAAVGFFGDRVERAMARQGSELLGADLAIEGSSAAPERWGEKAHSLGLAVARTLEFPTVAMGGPAPQLVQVKAVDPEYPLRGRLGVRDGPEAPERSVGQGPAAGEVWVDARLLHLLGLKLGESLALGESRLRIGAILSFEPDRSAPTIGLAPRVLMNRADVPATGLVSEASRVSWRLLLAGPIAAVDEFADWVRPRLPPNLGLKDGRTARPEFESAVERASRFMRLASLVTLLVAGAAVALASHRLVERQTDAVATMRCLGAPRHLLMRVFVLRLVALGLAASLAGCLLGWVAQLALVATLGGLLGAELPPPSLAPVWIGLATGMTALLGFALPPLIQLARVPPLRALRRDLGPPRASSVLAVLAGAGALAVLVHWQAGDSALAWRLLGGVGAGLAVLVGAVLVLVRLAGVLAGRVRGVWRLGLAGLARRPGAAVLQIAGFGLGILALLLLAVVRVDLLRTWQESLPEGAPNLFLINIQPDEAGAVQSFLESKGIQGAVLFPMIRGRLIRIGEREVRPGDYANPRAEQLAAREFNLSWGERPQSDNRIVDGRWWEGPNAPPQLSVERGVAELLGIRLGDRLTFWVSGHEVGARVTSLRDVRWDSFNVNFFVVSPPSLLAREPATYITSVHLPPGLDPAVAELVRAFPSGTPIDVKAILGQVRAVVDRGVLAVEYVFLFTLAAGLLVMVAGIQASLDERRAEHAILRTLGAGRRALLAGVAVELTLVGLLAGLLASAFAELTGWLLAERLFGLAFRFDPILWISGTLGSAVLIGLAGTMAAYPVLVRPPLAALRRP